MSHSPEAFFETCHASIIALGEYYLANIGKRNEATTRLHLIDRLIFDCLGWQSTDIVAEEHQRTERDEYADYTFFAPRRVMLWEAKRESAYFEVPAGYTGQKYSIKTLCKSNSALKAAISQASQYCQSRGIPIAVICNGHQLVAFIAARSDGVPPQDGHAIVFPGLPYMADHFTTFWNFFSKAGIEDKQLITRLVSSQRPELPSKLSAQLGDAYPGVMNRNEFQTDLKIVADILLVDLIGSPELEPEFLRRCYCRSGLLSRHSLVSKNMAAARYEAMFHAAPNTPTVVPAITTKGLSPELIAKSLRGYPTRSVYAAR